MEMSSGIYLQLTGISGKRRTTETSPSFGAETADQSYVKCRVKPYVIHKRCFHPPFKHLLFFFENGKNNLRRT